MMPQGVVAHYNEGQQHKQVNDTEQEMVSVTWYALAMGQEGPREAHARPRGSKPRLKKFSKQLFEPDCMNTHA
jgi:hypothetical protein